jgi:hypothetical protein
MERFKSLFKHSENILCIKSAEPSSQIGSSVKSGSNAIFLSFLHSGNIILSSFLNPIFSGIFGALGPVFNKQVVLSSQPTDDKLLAHVMNITNYPVITQVALNAIFIGLMLTVNTLSVKYKMLSFKYSGSFVGTAVIFSVSCFLSMMFDLIVISMKGKSVPANLIKQLLALVMICLGVGIIASESSLAKAKPPAMIQSTGVSLRELVQVEQMKLSELSGDQHNESWKKTSRQSSEIGDAAELSLWTLGGLRAGQKEDKHPKNVPSEYRGELCESRPRDTTDEQCLDGQLSILHNNPVEVRTSVITPLASGVSCGALTEV